MFIAKNIRRTGFTIVELLIVVAIIATLLCLLLPSLGLARELAKKAVCASNLGHLVKCNFMYAAEHNQYFVPAASDMMGKNLHRWHGERTKVNSAFDPKKSPLMPYMGSGGLKECPKFVKGTDYSDAAGQAAAFEAGCGGYGYNATYIGGRFDKHGYSATACATPAQVGDVANTSETIMFTDSAYIQSGSMIAYSFCEPPFWEFGTGNEMSGTMRSNPTIAFRHLGQANVACVDGSVHSEPLSFSVSYQTHSMVTGDEAEAQGIGWFGPDSNDLFDLK